MNGVKQLLVVGVLTFGISGTAHAQANPRAHQQHGSAPAATHTALEHQQHQQPTGAATGAPEHAEHQVGCECCCCRMMRQMMREHGQSHQMMSRHAGQEHSDGLERQDHQGERPN